MVKEKMVRVTIQLPEELYIWLKETARKEKRSMSSIIREAIQDYLAKQGY